MRGEVVTATCAPFGVLADGTPVEAHTLTAPNGVSARIVSYGAMLQTFNVPDRDGRIADITLGYDDLASYVDQPYYWGQTVGRYANRIARSRFTLDGEVHRLTANDGQNTLHGGARGFDARSWRVVDVEEGASASVTLALTSAHGDQGFPGTLEATVEYMLDRHGALTIDHRATTDRSTVVNMTNHAMFNLAGQRAYVGCRGQRLTIPARRFLPVDAGLIPTGEMRDVAGTRFDFRRTRALNALQDALGDAQLAACGGFDHCWVLDKGITAKPELAARLEDPLTGRVLEVLTTEAGLQFYSGNFLDGTRRGKGGYPYSAGDGVALEPQRFPDAPNQHHLGPSRLDSGDEYRHRLVFRVSCDRDALQSEAQPSNATNSTYFRS